MIRSSICKLSTTLPTPSLTMSRVNLPISFNAIGSATVGAPLAPLTRTVQSLQPDEVLSRVSFASINPMDFKIQHSNLFNLPLPMVLGYDFSGVVVAMGTEGEAPYAVEVEALTVGSAVMGSTHGFGSVETTVYTRALTSASVSRPLTVTVAVLLLCCSLRWGAGCFAEYVVAKRPSVVLRGDIPEAEASTYGIAYMSAYEPLFIGVDISKRSGQTIFIPGGAGGVGHFAVQLAKAFGLRVITSASKPEGLALLRQLQADVVVDYSRQDVVEEVLKVTGGRGVDLVYEATYVESSMKQSAAVVAQGGDWIRLGPWSHSRPGFQQEVEPIIASRGANVLVGDRSLYAKNPTTLPMRVEGPRLAKRLYAEGRMRPHISGTVPLEASALQQALQDSTKGTVGKVVVKA